MAIRDQDYYRRRIAEERAAAQYASSDYAREAHLDLADRYSDKLRLMEDLSSDSAFAELQPAIAPALRPQE